MDFILYQNIFQELVYTFYLSGTYSLYTHFHCKTLKTYNYKSVYVHSKLLRNPLSI